MFKRYLFLLYCYVYKVYLLFLIYPILFLLATLYLDTVIFTIVKWHFIAFITGILNIFELFAITIYTLVGLSPSDYQEKLKELNTIIEITKHYNCSSVEEAKYIMKMSDII